ncbi:response regulator [Planktotalea sp.]|uniref:response regulator n=1 Tax=Planktotalea sp. TaxID=2029877 RepID=UPI003F6CB952
MTTPTEQPLNTSRPNSPKITSIEQSPHVLIADDNEMNRIVITSSLEMLGCTTKSAVEGNDAFRLFEQEDFDLILMDNCMPVASRPAAAKRIRATAAPKCSVPIVGLTTSEDPTEKEVMLEAGMDIGYVKPLIQAVLRSILREYLKSASPF